MGLRAQINIQVKKLPASFFGTFGILDILTYLFIILYFIFQIVSCLREDRRKKDEQPIPEWLQETYPIMRSSLKSLIIEKMKNIPEEKYNIFDGQDLTSVVNRFFHQ